MNFFESCSPMPAWHAWLLALATILTALSSSLLSQEVYFFLNYIYQFDKVLFFKGIYRTDIYAAQIRFAYTGLIYRKVSEKENE